MPTLTILRKLSLVILSLIILFSLTGCGKKESNNEDSKKEKLDQEISYLDSKIVTMMNKLNNISFSNYKIVSENIKEEQTGSTNQNKKESSSNSESSSGSDSSSSNSESEGSQSGGESESSSSQSGEESGSSNGEESSGQTQSSESSENNQIFKMTQDVLLLNDDEQNNEIKWGEIRQDIENIYAVWPTISIDLASVGINNEDILQFNGILDEVAINATDKNKDSALTNLSKLYNLIPKYINSYSDNQLSKTTLDTKSYVLNAYSLVNSENWDEVDSSLTKANEAFSGLISHQDNYPNKELNINRSYLLLNDLKKSVEKKDKQIFYVRYKNLLQELNIIIS